MLKPTLIPMACLLFGGIGTALASEPLPLITAQSRDQNVPTGHPVRLYLDVAEQGDWLYRWSRDGLPVNDTAEPELWLEDIAPADAGDYSVALVSNDGTTLVQLVIHQADGG